MFIFIDTYFSFFIVMPLLDLQAIWGCHNSQTLAPRKSLQKKKRGKNVLLEQMRTNTDLQVQNNELLRQLVEQQYVS
jgi:hypothetical protein